MLRDIRELTSDQDAYAEELRRRWGGLLSYRYIGRQFASMDVGDFDDTVTLRHDMRDATGGILFAVIGISSPEGGGMNDLDAVPNPVIHSIQILDPGRDVRRIEIVSEVLRRGRQMSYSRSRIVDADNPTRVLALTEGQGAVIGVPPEGLQRMDTGVIEVEDSPSLPPLWEVFAAESRGDGVWALPELKPELASPDAALHIGPQFVVLETAATELAAGLAGTDQIRGLSAHVMFLARGKTGPFRTEGQAFPAVDGNVGVRLVLVDEGADGRTIATGSYVFTARP
jgi:acyl-coenzyme A thioesterase PaaI-like protein